MSKEELTFEEMVVHLEKKIELLVSKNIEMRDENRELRSQVEFLLKETSQRQSKVEELTLLLRDAKLSSAFNEVYDTKNEAIIAVEKMLQDIDDCVALINR